MEKENKEELKEYFEEWMNIEKMIKDKNVKGIDKNTKKKIFNYFNNEMNKQIILNIFIENEYENIMIIKIKI